jgi:hypothetical protein
MPLSSWPEARSWKARERLPITEDIQGYVLVAVIMVVSMGIISTSMMEICDRKSQFE